jgi:hypothetical protein
MCPVHLDRLAVLLSVLVACDRFVVFFRSRCTGHILLLLLSSLVACDRLVVFSWSRCTGHILLLHYKVYQGYVAS